MTSNVLHSTIQDLNQRASLKPLLACFGKCVKHARKDMWTHQRYSNILSDLICLLALRAFLCLLAVDQSGVNYSEALTQERVEPP